MSRYQKNYGTITLQCENIFEFNNGLAAVQINEKWGFVNQRGEVVITCIYEDALDFFMGFSNIEDGEGKAIIDKQGNKVISWKEEVYEMYKLRSELFIFRKNKVWSIFNLQTKKNNSHYRGKRYSRLCRRSDDCGVN